MRPVSIARLFAIPGATTLAFALGASWVLKDGPVAVTVLAALGLLALAVTALTDLRTVRSRDTMFWKNGVVDAQAFLARTADMRADPTRVNVPFLSILGGGDSPVFAAQAHAWHAAIPSTNKRFVLPDAASGADGHVQVNNRLRLAQECVGWMDELFARSR